MNAAQRAQLIEVAARALIAHGEDPEIAVWEAEGVIDSLGITQDQWHSDAAVRWDGVTDYPTFRISAVENLPDYGSTLDSQPTKAEA